MAEKAKTYSGSIDNALEAAGFRVTRNHDKTDTAVRWSKVEKDGEKFKVMVKTCAADEDDAEKNSTDQPHAVGEPEQNAPVQADANKSDSTVTEPSDAGAKTVSEPTGPQT